MLVRFPLSEVALGSAVVALWWVWFDVAVMVAWCVIVELALMVVKVVLVAFSVLLVFSDEVVDADSVLDSEAEDVMLAELDAEEEDEVTEDETENSGVKLIPPDASVIWMA